MTTRKRLFTRILTFVLIFSVVITSISLLPGIGIQKVCAGDILYHWQWPVPHSNNNISSYFGGRDDPLGGGWKFHEGIDICPGQGTPVKACADGVVTIAKVYYGYGNCVIIDHGNGIKTLYGHMLNNLQVQKGQHIQQGKVVGYVGNTGNSTGPHLHLEFILKGNVVNPLNYLGKVICKSHSWNTKTGKCISCGTTYASQTPKLDTSIKTVSPSKLFKLRAKTDVKVYPNTGSNNAKVSVATGTIVHVYGTVSSGSWYKVNAGGAIGFVQKSQVEGPFAGTQSMSKLKVIVNGFTIKQGQSHTISGTVSSNFPITKITGKIGGQSVTMTTADFGSNKTSVTLAGKKIDTNLKCGKLASGTHTLSVTAVDAVGKTVTGTATVTVNGSVKTPVIGNPVDVSGGKKVTITQKESGATLYYKIGSQTYKTTTSSSVTIPAITAEGKTNVTAYSMKSGKKSAATSKTVAVSKLATPTVHSSQEGRYIKATIKGASGSSLMYKIDNVSYAPYNGQVLSLRDKQVLSCYAKKNGCINSSVQTYTAELAEPAVPEVKLMNPDNTVGTGKSVTVGWTKDKRASVYKTTLYNSEDDSVVEEKEITGTSVSFTLPKEGKYYVVVVAENEIGTSEASKHVSVNAKNPLKVVFRDAAEGDDEGQILHEMTVDYGAKISEISAPSRKGHNFVGWLSEDETVSANGYLKTAVKSNLTYTAVYEAKKFKVKLFDQNGAPLETQTVEYNRAVDTDNAESRIESSPSYESGYRIAGWQVRNTSDGNSLADISHVDSDMEIQAIVEWGNKDLPVVATIESSVQNGEYIEATVKLSHDEDRDLSMYLIYALKAKDNATGTYKSVYLDRKVVEVPANAGIGDAEKTVNIRMRPRDIAGISKFEVTAVECKADMTTGTAYSELKSNPVTVRTEYGPLSDEKYTSESQIEAKPGREIVSATEYRYRDQETKYDGHDTLSGYTKAATEYYNFSTSKWQSSKYTKNGAYYGAGHTGGDTYGSGYKDTKAYVATASQLAYAYVTDKKDWFWTNAGGTSRSGQKTTNTLTIYSQKAVSAFPVDSSDSSYKLPKTISSVDSGTSSPSQLGTIYRINWNGDRVNSFTSAAANTYVWKKAATTIYLETTVRSRNKFTRWGSYSAWTDKAISSSSTRQVEKRTVYRYRDRLTEDKTAGIDVDGKCVRHIEGNLDIEQNLNGKKATIMVYQAHNSDPNKYQLQYLGQTEIAVENHYSFDFIPREEPNAESDTGNYIVALSVEGVSGLINVKTIEADPIRYTVNLFYTDDTDLDDDGNARIKYISEGIEVNEHSNVDMSGIEIPEREGYVFMGWKNRTTDIAADCAVDGVCNIEAAYAPKQYAVVFVDWINQKLNIVNAVMGEKVELPIGTEDTEGYVFKGWKTEDGTLYEPTADEPVEIIVTGNMVVSAELDAIRYNVKFIGANNEVVSDQQVAYGEAANPPSYTAPAGKGTFAGWSTNVNWWNVDSDVNVRAIMTFDEQAMAPTSMIVTDENTEERSLVLETEEKNGDIYYTTDGTEPTIEMIQDYIEYGADSYKGSVVKYDEPIQLTDECDGFVGVSAVTYTENKDISDVICATLVENNPEEEYVVSDGIGEWVELSKTTVKANSGKDVVVDVSLEENSGLTGYDFLVESDKGVFYADADEYGAPEFTEGVVSESGTMYTTESDEGWRVNWSSESGSTATGNMFSLTLHVDDEAEEGQYPITVYYAPEHTYDTDYESTELENVKVTVTSEASVQIKPEDVSLARTSYVYEGVAIEPAVRIEGLKEGDDYTVEYVNNINAGTAKALITGVGDYAGTVEKEFTIAPANIANADIEEIPNQVVTGDAIEPELSIKYNDVVLEKDKDYEVSFENNTEIGTANVTIRGLGNFSKSTNLEFNIIEREATVEELKQRLAEVEAAKADAESRLATAEDNMSKAETALSQAEKDLADAVKRAEEGDAEARNQIDYLTTAKNEAELKLAAAEKAKADADRRVEEAEQKAAEAEKALEEAQKNGVITLSTITVSGIKSKTYTGSEITPEITVNCDDAELLPGIDYDVSYINNVNVGTAKLVINGKGKYAGSISKTFSINPKGTSVSALTRGIKSIKVKWKKQAVQTTGYQVRYSQKSSMISSKTVTIAKNSTTYKTVKNLKSGKKYYVQVRTYKSVDGKKYYSAWSTKKHIQVK